MADVVEVPGETLETPVADENPTETEQPFDPERAMATIKKLREFEKRAKAQEKELAALKAAEDERKRATMSEVERLKADLEAAQKAVKEANTERVKATIRAQVVQAATSAGMHDPADALGHLGRMELDDNGEIPELGKRLDELKARKPYLFKGQQTISPTNPLGATPKPSDSQVLQQIFGQQSSKLWDGGGVVWNNPE